MVLRQAIEALFPCEAQQRREACAKSSRGEMLLALEHACSCPDGLCTQQRCRAIKQLVNHLVTCQVRNVQRCGMCRKVGCLLNVHASSCALPLGTCRVPGCEALHDRRSTAAQGQVAAEGGPAARLPCAMEQQRSCC